MLQTWALVGVAASASMGVSLSVSVGVLTAASGGILTAASLGVTSLASESVLAMVTSWAENSGKPSWYTVCRCRLLSRWDSRTWWWWMSSYSALVTTFAVGFQMTRHCTHLVNLSYILLTRLETTLILSNVLRYVTSPSTSWVPVAAVPSPL